MEEENKKELGQLELTPKQKKELNDAWKEIMEDAKKVVEDYAKDPSQISGSVIRIHEDSPFLDGDIKFNQWKHVTKGSFLDEMYESIKDEKKVKKDKKKT